MVRRILAIGCFLGILFGVGYGGTGFYLQNWSKQPVQLGQEKVVELERGMTLERFSKALQKEGVVDHAYLFKLWVKRYADYAKFQAGKYLFSGRVTPHDVVGKIISGKVHTPIIMRIAIPEGFTIKQVASRMAANGIGQRASNLALMKSRSFLKDLSVPSSTAEGYIYPAVYEFSQIPTPKEFLTKAIKTFWERLPEDYLAILRDKKITLSTAVIIASLIEMETAIEEEKNMVSEVIWRRIARKDFLGIDAAIIYGIEDYDGDIKTVHLKDRSNPYNTRVHRGLPPTAIGAVSASSLQAVINPTNYRYYYYVAKTDGSRRHHFSKTLKEHNRHVQKLVRATSRSKDSSKR